MVKNNKGGKQAKKQAKKFSGGNGFTQGNRHLRVPDLDDELFAVVTKFYGHGQIDVQCIDGITRLCIIRNKFKGRGKQSNLVKVFDWVLVGKRSWEIRRCDKKEQCDLLEIYSESDKDKLRERCTVDFSPLKIEKDNDECDDSHISFVDEGDECDEEILLKPQIKPISIEELDGEDNDEIDIDLI